MYYAVIDEDGFVLNDGSYTGVGALYETREDAEEEMELEELDGASVIKLARTEPLKVTEEQGETLEHFQEQIDQGFLDTTGCDPHGLTLGTIVFALDNGWDVIKEERWYVIVPKEWSGDGDNKERRLYKRDDGSIGIVLEDFVDGGADEQFTQAEIEHYHLGGFEPVEVED